MVWHDRGVCPRLGGGQAIGYKPVTCPIVEEVLGDPEPCVPHDIELGVLLAIPTDVDLEHPVEPLALCADDPFIARDIVAVEHGEQVGREPRLGGIVDRQLRAEIDPVRLPCEVARSAPSAPVLALKWRSPSGGDISASVTSPGSVAATAPRSAGAIVSRS